MEFHTKTGPRAALSEDKRSARRENFDQAYNGAMVFSSVPLEDDFLFEVKIEEKATTWNDNGGLMFGVTSQRPDLIGSLPEYLIRLRHSWTFYRGCSFSVSNPGNNFQRVSFGRFNDLNVGDTVGIMRKSTAALHVYVNGEEKGSAFTDVPSGCYAALDLCGSCVAVSVVNREAVVQPGMVSIEIAQWKIADFKRRLFAVADLSKAKNVKRMRLSKSSDGDDAYIPSARFTHKSLPGFEWFLKIYPNGYGTEASSYVSVELCVEKSGKKSSATALTAHFSASFTSAKGESTLPISSQPTKFIGNAAVCVIEKFASHERVEKMCTDDGSITFSGKIVIDPPFSSQHAEYLRRCYESGDFSDFKIRVENEPVEFAVHKNILSEASPFFKAMFHSQCDEAKEGKVTIRESSLYAVKAMLQYIYGDPLCFDGPEELSIYVLKLADQYDLCGLKEVCEKVLTKMITKENALEFAQIGDLCRAAALKKAAFQFISDNKEILAEETWINFREEKERSKLVIEILEFIIAKLLDNALKK